MLYLQVWPLSQGFQIQGREKVLVGMKYEWRTRCAIRDGKGFGEGSKFFPIIFQMSILLNTPLKALPALDIHSGPSISIPGLP